MDGNRPLRLGGSTGTLVQARLLGTSAWPLGSDPVAMPITDMLDSLEGLATNNSYNQYALQMLPKKAVNVTINSKTYYDDYFDAGAHPQHAFHEKGVVVMADVIKATAMQKDIDLSTRDVVAVFTFDDYWPAPTSVGRLAWMPTTWGGALGVFHEWGHGYLGAHANAYPFSNACAPEAPCYFNTCPVVCQGAAPMTCGSKVSLLTFDAGTSTFTSCAPGSTTVRELGCDYGDVYDYMGLQAPARNCVHIPRYKQGLLQYFAADNSVHEQPMRKYQQGWLLADDIQTLTNPGTYTLSVWPISTDPHVFGNPGLPVAIEIPRRLLRNPEPQFNRELFTTESLLVYWRDNEPLLNDPQGGVATAQISLVSRHQTNEGAQTLTFNDDLVPTLLDHEDAALDNGQTLHDAESGVDIKCLGLVNGYLQVQCTVSPTIPVFDQIPIVGITAPEATATAPLGETLLNIGVTACNPVLNMTSWAGIAKIQVELIAGELQNRRTLASHEFTSTDPTETWQLWVGKTTGPSGTQVPLVDTNGATIRSTCVLQATAFTESEYAPGVPYTNRAIIKFLIDQDGPSSW